MLKCVWSRCEQVNFKKIRYSATMIFTNYNRNRMSNSRCLKNAISWNDFNSHPGSLGPGFSLGMVNRAGQNPPSKHLYIYLLQTLCTVSQFMAHQCTHTRARAHTHFQLVLCRSPRLRSQYIKSLELKILPI